jgi:hypothetical protein
MLELDGHTWIRFSVWMALGKTFLNFKISLSLRTSLLIYLTEDHIGVLHFLKCESTKSFDIMIKY